MYKAIGGALLVFSVFVLICLMYYAVGSAAETFVIIVASLLIGAVMDLGMRLINHE